MAYDKEIRFRSRALFEVLGKSLSEISEQESVPLSTLSEWKNDDREEWGGIWLKGSKTKRVEETTKKLREELQATSVYDEMKKSIKQHYGITQKGHLEVDGGLDIAGNNAEMQARVEADVLLLASVQADYFDAQLFKNSLLSSIVLSNQVKKDVTKIRQADIKASSEIHKMAKEARFGKSPDMVIFNANGNYTPEELEELTVEQLEELMRKEEQKVLEQAKSKQEIVS